MSVFRFSKTAIVAGALLCVGCNQATWDREGGPSVEQFPAPLRVVQARARMADGGVQLDLRNTGSEAMCFWAADFPTQGRALGFRVFNANGVERRRGEVLPAGNRVLEIDAGETLSTKVGLEAWFGGDLQDEDCVLFEALYFPCAQADGLNRSAGTPLDISGLIQSSWRVERGRLSLIPQSEPSCRRYSGLIRQ
jgi:hypothetical protein